MPSVDCRRLRDAPHHPRAQRPRVSGDVMPARCRAAAPPPPWYTGGGHPADGRRLHARRADFLHEVGQPSPFGAVASVTRAGDSRSTSRHGSHGAILLYAVRRFYAKANTCSICYGNLFEITTKIAKTGFECRNSPKHLIFPHFFEKLRPARNWQFVVLRLSFLPRTRKFSFGIINKVSH